MDKKQIVLSGIYRFFRVLIPQLAVLLPVLIDNADKIKAILPLWVLPVLVCLGAIVTALDKVLRDLKAY